MQMEEDRGSFFESAKVDYFFFLLLFSTCMHAGTCTCGEERDLSRLKSATALIRGMVLLRDEPRCLLLFFRIFNRRYDDASCGIHPHPHIEHNTWRILVHANLYRIYKFNLLMAI